MTGLSHHFRDPLNLVLSILVVLSLMGAWMYTKEAAGIDYYVAWVAADAVKNDTPKSIYDPSSTYTLALLYRNKADELKDAPLQKQLAGYRRELPMTATPFMYWVTGALSSGEYAKDLSTWHAVSLILLTVSFFLICRMLGYSVATSLALFLPVIVWFAPLQSDLRVANVNSFQFGLIGLILWLQSHDADRRFLFATGLVVGLTVMFKPNLAPVALLLAGGWAVRHQFLKLAIGIFGMVSGAVTAIGVSSWWMGSASVWTEWLNVINRTVHGGPGDGGGNYAIMLQLTDGMGSLGQLTLAVSLCLIYLVFLWWGRRGIIDTGDDLLEQDRERLENMLLVATGCIIAMLASALVWLHYYLLTIPMLLVAFRPLPTPARMNFLPLLMLRVLPGAALVCLLDTALQRFLNIESASYWSVATITYILILSVVGLWQFGYGMGTRTQNEPAT